MTAKQFLNSIAGWLRAGYPKGVPEGDYIPLLALLPRRLTNDELNEVANELMARDAFDAIDVGVLITQITDELPSPQNVEQVQARLAAEGIQRVFALGNPVQAIKLWLYAVGDHTERARQLARLSSSDWNRLGELLDSATGPEVFESIDDELAARALNAIAAPRASSLLVELDSDHAAEILRAMRDHEREKLLAALPPARGDALRGLLQWPKDSAAAHMVPETLTVGPTLTAADAIAAVRVQAATIRSDTHTASYIYVTEPGGRLLGVVPFRSLVLADANSVVTDLMERNVVTVSPLADAEKAAQTLIDHRLLALPLVDNNGRLHGVITADDAADIAEEEATRDAELQGGSTPLEVPYLRAPPVLLWRKRIVWLLALFAAEAYTGTVLRSFESYLETVVALTFFIPLLIGTGGNTGTQIVTTLVRAMATAQIRIRDLPAIIAKELSAGTMIAISMALAAVIRAWTLGVGRQVTVTVSLSVAAVVLWASLVASILPPMLKKLRVDPAVVSGPAIATIVDGTGLLIYFMIAKMTLPQLGSL